MLVVLLVLLFEAAGDREHIVVDVDLNVVGVDSRDRSANHVGIAVFGHVQSDGKRVQLLVPDGSCAAQALVEEPVHRRPQMLELGHRIPAHQCVRHFSFLLHLEVGAFILNASHCLAVRQEP
ncbi:MAG: hypothetical protein U5Q44_02895 [Dehalococcoidia bacterium]|nr:hypothetical protein [Dehalococcoidia bacterium]